MLLPPWLKVAIAFAVFCIPHAVTSGNSNGEGKFVLDRLIAMSKCYVFFLDNTQKVVQMITTSYNNDAASVILLLRHLADSAKRNEYLNMLGMLLDKSDVCFKNTHDVYILFYSILKTTANHYFKTSLRKTKRNSRWIS